MVYPPRRHRADPRRAGATTGRLTATQAPLGKGSPGGYRSVVRDRSLLPHHLRRLPADGPPDEAGATVNAPPAAR